MKKRLKIVENIKEAQKNETTCDDYAIGLYNGMELALSILQDRKAELLFSAKEQQVEVQEEQTGRTVISGVRKRGD